MEKNAPFYTDFEQLCDRIKKELSGKERLILAIEGSSGSGKTTLAKRLSECFSAVILHTDDFFLPLDRKTPLRLSQPGGNIDYERLKEEVADKLSAGKHILYRPFDCKIQQIGEGSLLSLAPLCILEGVYSLHPYLGKYYDLSVFVTLPVQERLERLRNRVSPELFAFFTQEWIPLEDRYFEHFDIRQNCDIILKG